jgi:two-component system, cell cycle sensor histidine kinase and response regulator CckA
MSDPESAPERQPTILLVDDHPSIRLILSAGLQAHGFDVLTAATGEKAMALCEAFDGPIDLLLADVGLTPQELWPQEGTDDSIPHGAALAERAIHLRPKMKVVLFTGYSDERLERLGAATRGFMLLRKPCGLPTLINTFRRMLEEKSKEKDAVLRVAEETEAYDDL